MVWLAVAFFLVAVLGSMAYAATRAWRLWRAVRTTSGNASEAIGRVMDSAASAEAQAAGLTAGAERLSAATARLGKSLAELAAIRAAAAEPQKLLASLRGVVPGK